MHAKEFEIQTKNLIDSLKGVCTSYGLGNDGNDQFVLAADLTLSRFSAIVRGLPVTIASARILTTGSDLLIRDMSGQIANSPYTFNGLVRSPGSTTRSWEGKLAAQLDLPDLLRHLKTKSTLRNAITANGPIPFAVAIFGTPKRTAAFYSSAIDPAIGLHVHTSVGVLSQPANTPMTIAGSLAYAPGDPAVLRFYDNKINIGTTALSWRGNLTWPDRSSRTEPVIDITVSLPHPVSAHSLMALLPAPSLQPLLQEMTGSVGGQITFAGPLSAPSTRGLLQLHGVSIPSLGVAGITGSIEAPNGFSPLNPAATAGFGGTSEAILHIDSLTAGKIYLSDIVGTISTEKTPEGTRVNMERLTASLYGGTIELQGNIMMSPDRSYALKISASEIDVSRVMAAVSGSGDDVKGNLSAESTLSGLAGSKDEFIKTSTGDGHFTITNGAIKNLGQLQSNLTRLNFLNQGILGFNINNLLAAIHPKNNGAFRTFSGNVSLATGIVQLADLLFDGEQLHMRGQGVLDLVSGNARVQVAGNIPRNPRFLKGPIGKLLQHLSIARLFDFVTHGAFENMPDIPILGTLASHKRRAFELEFIGNIHDANSFSESAKKTFHWLPNQPKATPHPIFGIAEQAEQAPM